MVAHDALAIEEAGGSVAETVTARGGGAYDPEVARVFGAAWKADRADAGADILSLALDAEPGEPVTIAERDIDRVAMAIADFTDLKSPYLLGHSTRVAELAEGGARVSGMTRDECTTVRRAALLHDVGRTGVPNGIWDKPGRLSGAEMERVRLHAYYTERVLARTPTTAPLALIAASHHENLDGSGYHRGVGAAYLDQGSRLLHAADCLDAMVSERPHRQAMTHEEATRALEGEVQAGRLDASAVIAVIEASGGERIRLRTPRPGGLSEREVEVLRLMVRGLSNKQMGARLFLSPKTVGHHVQHIYTKIGVSSRAAAALFAMESGLA